MSPFRALILGLVQGATEFIPVSSSGHLVLVPWLVGWTDPGLVFDTVVHWGTLAAVVTYFWRDLLDLAAAWVDSLREWSLNPDPRRRVAWLIIVGTVPAGLAGFFLEDFFGSLFASPPWVAGLLMVTGLLLMAGERWGRYRQAVETMSWGQALLVGVAQALAIAPGISRSGATITAGLLVGLDRHSAARYSFLLATPIIAAAGLLQIMRLVSAVPSPGSLVPLVLGFLAAAGSGFICIRFLLGFLQWGSLRPFAVYCWSVGLATLVVAVIR